MAASDPAGDQFLVAGLALTVLELAEVVVAAGAALVGEGDDRPAGFPVQAEGGDLRSGDGWHECLLGICGQICGQNRDLAAARALPPGSTGDPTCGVSAN